MFGLDMFGSYDQRKVDRFGGEDGLMVSTAEVTDADKPYETAIIHKSYSDKHIIVATYDTKKEAQVGHDKWVATITADDLPDKLVDVSSAGVAKLSDLCEQDWRVYKKK